MKLTEKGIKQRNIIIAAADYLMRERGYEDMTLRMLADKVNISRGHLGHYFSEKRELIFELIHDILGKIWGESERLCRSYDDPRVTYGFALNWYLLLGVYRFDLRRLTFQGMHDWDILHEFSKTFADNYLKNLGEITDARREKLRISMDTAFFATSGELSKYEDNLTAEHTGRVVENHIRIMCILNRKPQVGATRIIEKVNRLTEQIGGERLADMLEKNYEWYVVENHEFKIE